MLYLEDLKVGDHFISREYEMTLDEVKQFAGQYDPQPFHLDEQAAPPVMAARAVASASFAANLVMFDFPVSMKISPKDPSSYSPVRR